MQAGNIRPKPPFKAEDLAELFPEGTTEIINGIMVYYHVPDSMNVGALVGDQGYVEEGDDHRFLPEF